MIQSRVGRRCAALLLCALLFLLCSCAGSSRNPEEDAPASVSLAEILELLVGVSDAALQVDGTAAVLEKAPHLMAVLDVDRDGVLEFADLNSIDPREPTGMVRTYIAVREVAELIHQRKK